MKLFINNFYLTACD